MDHASEDPGLADKLVFRCLSVITGRSIPDEHRHPSFDLVAKLKLRARRLRWAGQVLRQDTEQSLVKQVLLALANHDMEQQNNSRGSLLIDAPGFKSSLNQWKSCSSWLKTPMDGPPR